MKSEKLFEAILALAQAKDEAEALRTLKDHPELLEDETDIILQQMISNAKQNGDTQEGKILGYVREFVRTQISSGTRESSQNGSELSEILQELSRLARLGDMPRRIKLCRMALELITPENASLWSALHVQLGNSLAQSTIGDQADNIEQAIDHYEQVLMIRTQKDFPVDWATIQNNLANAYNNRIRGDPADNIEQAIDHYDQALKIRTQKDFPVDWATTQNNLANAYNNRIRGDRADNIEQAIEHCEQALKIRTQKDFPAYWATTQNILAAAYKNRIRGDRVDNIEQAIEHCHQAMKIYTLEGFPADWATIQNNLANAYNDRILGDPADNIEQAIDHYEQALKIKTQRDFPADWATIQNNLANAGNNRIRGDRADNIEQAIDHYEQALKVYTQKNFPADWAMTQNNLANTYKNRIRGDRANNIEQAIDHYEQALKVRTQKDFPAYWAMTQNNLAVAYKNRIRGDRADNIEQAIDHYELALEVYTPKEFPYYCRWTAYRMGNLCMEDQRFSEAGNAYSLGIESVETLYGAAIFQSSREAELAETRDLYRHASYAQARSGDAMKAVEALERGRARGLGLSLARDRADMERVQEKDQQAYKDYWQTVADLQNLESQERGGASAEGKASPPLRDLMMRARTRLGEVLDRIRRIQGYESFLKEPGWQEIADATIVGQPLVYLAAAPASGVALIVHRPSESQDATVDSVNLDGFSEQRLQEFLKIWFDAYRDWRVATENLQQNKIGPEDYLQAKERWFDAIEEVTGQLWQEVIGQIFSYLSSLEAQQVFLIPTGLLSLLPLHAAWTEKDGRKRYLLEMMPVSYIPSARSLAHVRCIANVAGSEKLLAVDEPRTIKPSHLPNSHAEVTAIISHFPSPQILEHEKATRSAALLALPGVQVAHFSCHGGADWSDPENSGLLMANDEILTVKDLFELHLNVARLATLSACETGVPGTKLPDEVVSLPSAFIRAGFAGAIGSLWTVQDESTARLMTCFYELWREKGMSPVQALAEAQKELRNQEMFQHPFYWAAFYLTGV